MKKSHSRMKTTDNSREYNTLLKYELCFGATLDVYTKKKYWYENRWPMIRDVKELWHKRDRNWKKFRKTQYKVNENKKSKMYRMPASLQIQRRY